MNRTPLILIRTAFFAISSLIFTTYIARAIPLDSFASTLSTGVALGLLATTILTGMERLASSFTLVHFNLSLIGLLLGAGMSLAVTTITLHLLTFISPPVTPEVEAVVVIGIYLVCLYFAVTLTIKAGQELHLTIPFTRLRQPKEKKKDILIDQSILEDPRMIDLASSGLLDRQLVMPRFALKDLYREAESEDETARARAKRSLDVLKSLEQIDVLQLRYADVDFPEVKESLGKLIRLARLDDSVILTADINRIQQSSYEGVRIINIHSLANALKPVTQSGEILSIKIQRYGKEPRQGVGYLEDGTMVVVNGGAEYIGESIEAHVLSVKHTSSGRMIFCNAPDEEFYSDPRTLSRPLASVT